MQIDVKQFDGLDLPEWVDDKTADIICSFLNSLHQMGFKGVRFHTLNRAKSNQLYLHLNHRELVPFTAQEALAGHALAFGDLVNRLRAKEKF